MPVSCPTAPLGPSDANKYNLDHLLFLSLPPREGPQAVACLHREEIFHIVYSPLSAASTVPADEAGREAISGYTGKEQICLL